MSWRRQTLAGLVVLFLWTSSLVRADKPLPAKTALDDYIAKPDPAYQWKLVDKKVGPRATTYFIELTSQNWRTEKEVDRTLWKHWLTIVKPDKVEFDTAFLYIVGGDNRSGVPTKAETLTMMTAMSTHSVAMELHQIPNQPLIFNNDGKERKEDDLIAYCWIKFLDTGDPTWLPRFPMVKSAVRAMDAATEFLASEAGGKVDIKHFVVAGGSKRGWTTWLTAAVDPRVVACIPISIDIVNVRATMSNHYASYGFWLPAVGNYVAHHVMERSETPEYDQMLRLIDPYFYRHRLELPKFILCGAGDQFFTPDSSRFYYDDLLGPKYIRYVANGDHGLGGTDAGASAMAFYEAILTKTPIPTMKWKLEPDGTFTVTASAKPNVATLWQATNPKVRDFRKVEIGNTAYKASIVKPDEKGVYRIRVGKPPEGWTAYFVEMAFPGPNNTTFKFSTAVQIVPDVLPHSLEEFFKSLPKKAAPSGSGKS